MGYIYQNLGLVIQFKTEQPQKVAPMRGRSQNEFRKASQKTLNMQRVLYKSMVHRRSSKYYTVLRHQNPMIIP
jgi:hypothetical protein